MSDKWLLVNTLCVKSTNHRDLSPTRSGGYFGKKKRNPILFLRGMETDVVESRTLYVEGRLGAEEVPEE